MFWVSCVFTVVCAFSSIRLFALLLLVCFAFGKVAVGVSVASGVCGFVCLL